MAKIQSPLEVKQLSFSKLLKNEVPALAKLVIEVVEKHNPEELQIKEIYDLLVKETPQIEKLNAIYGVHPITVKLKPKREQLLLEVSALRLQLKVASKMTSVDILEAVMPLSLAYDAYLSKLRKNKNEQVILEKITAFLDLLDNDLELLNAVETLGLNSLINSIEHSLVTVKSFHFERTSLISQRPKEKTRVTTKTVTQALKNLFKQIEVAQLKNTELDYRPLFHELNDTMGKYRKLINIRDSFNKKKAEEMQGRYPVESRGTEGEATAITLSVVNDEDVMPESVQEFPTINPFVKGNGKNELKENLDITLNNNKAIATSAKQSQLPDLKSESEL